MMTGAGIGGEYAAVNSAIQELIPARKRGTTDLAVNGTFWGGAALGSVIALVVLNPAVVDPEIGWRSAFVVGGALCCIVLFLRRFLPESPRWLMIKGRNGRRRRRSSAPSSARSRRSTAARCRRSNTARCASTGAATPSSGRCGRRCSAPTGSAPCSA